MKAKTHTHPSLRIYPQKDSCSKPRIADSRAAFTLIELLVVIAIIALLMTLVFPVAGAVMERARFVQCGQRKGEMYDALMLYALDHKGEIPSPAGGGGASRWTDLMSPYLEGAENYDGWGTPEQNRCPNIKFYSINVHSTGLNPAYAGLFARNTNLAESIMLADSRNAFQLYYSNFTGHFRHYDPTRTGIGTMSVIFGDGHWGSYTKEEWDAVYSKPHDECDVLNPR
ncbi:type II secretion system protein [Kiritimatiellaeota bacterium B1221]|nr:type II secretion system protein [Kiritimatiellaeota bacterium B1221]